MNCPGTEALLRLLDGAQTEERAAEIRSHASACSICRARLEELEGLVERVGARHESYRNSGRLAAIEHRIEDAGESRPAGARARRTLALGAAAVLAMAGFLALVLAPGSDNGPDEEGFQARAAPGDAPRWVGIRMFHLREGRPQRVERVIRADDRVLFSYTNLDPAPYRWLSIAARDAAGRIHWIHPPAAEDPRAPASVAVKSGVAREELPETIRLPLAPGPLLVAGLFSERPLARRDVESWLRDSAKGEAVSAPQDAVVQILSLTVRQPVTEE